MPLSQETKVLCGSSSCDNTLTVESRKMRDVRATAVEAGWSVKGRGEGVEFLCPAHCPECGQDLPGQPQSAYDGPPVAMGSADAD